MDDNKRKLEIALDILFNSAAKSYSRETQVLFGFDAYADVTPADIKRECQTFVFELLSKLL